MKFTDLIFAVVGVSSVAEALTPGITLTPRPYTMQKRRVARKSIGTARSHPMRLAERPEGEDAVDSSGNSTFGVTTSGNWAGVVLRGSGYKTVSGTFNVAQPSIPPGAWPYQTYSYAAWVGIDGDTCQSAILQAGIQASTSAFGVPTYSAWYEWFPDASYTFSGFPISARDSITVTVEAESTTSGNVTIVNHTKGTHVSHTFNNQKRGALCETNAEWIVEDFEECYGQNVCGLVPMADFGTITFTDTTPAMGGEPTVINLVQNRRTMTNCGAQGNSTVFCEYI